MEAPFGGYLLRLAGESGYKIVVVMGSFGCRKVVYLLYLKRGVSNGGLGGWLSSVGRPGPESRSISNYVPLSQPSLPSGRQEE